METKQMTKEELKTAIRGLQNELEKKEFEELGKMPQTLYYVDTWRNVIAGARLLRRTAEAWFEYDCDSAALDDSLMVEFDKDCVTPITEHVFLTDKEAQIYLSKNLIECNKMLVADFEKQVGLYEKKIAEYREIVAKHQAILDKYKESK